LSANYLDILKDRLYCSAAAGPLRRSAQTALWEILLVLTRLMAPILSFTAEEVWQCLPEGAVAERSVHLAALPEANKDWQDKELAASWDLFLTCRSAAYNALELARKQKLVGSFMEARVSLHVEAALLAKLQGKEELLADVFIVSAIKISGLAKFAPDKHEVIWKGEQASLGKFKVGVDSAEGQKCERCWNYRPSVGQNSSYSTLCARCAEVIRNETG
jgi:isoleucyl-tRNA synthetase